MPTLFQISVQYLGHEDQYNGDKTKKDNTSIETHGKKEYLVWLREYLDSSCKPATGGKDDTH